MGILHASFLAIGYIVCSTAHADPLKVLAIGDSLTEEYRFELPFSAPKSLIPPIANTTNWVEILADHRADHFSMGSYTSTLLAYGDYRNAGYKFNYGVPGFKSQDWIDVIEASLFDFSTIGIARTATRENLIDHLDRVDAVIIFLGGNDLKSDYTGIFRDDVPPPVMDQLLENLAELHDFVRSRKSSIPILIATAPDIGACHVIATDSNYADPVMKIRARQRVATMNQQIIAFAASRSATVIRIDHLTNMIYDMAPFHINGTEFSFTPDDNNAPLHIFCHDGFHPASMAQSIIANLIIDGLNQATSAGIPKLENREILSGVVGVNPDQPYLDWAAGAGGMLENPDGDGLQNLAEFLLGTSPLQADSPWTFGDAGEIHFHPVIERLRFASLGIEESTTLTNDWENTPENKIDILPDGTWRILPAGPKRFYRLSATPRP